MSAEMLITSLVPWFGGKRTLAPDIVAEFGQHKAYFEPFCGSMAVLLAKRETALECVNDLHGGLICLARVLADEWQASRLYDRLQRTLFHEELLQEAQAYIGHDADAASCPPWDFAYWYFVASWMGRNGTSGTARINYQPAVRWSADGGSPTVRFDSAVESIPAWHRRLKNVVMLRRDAFDIIPRFDDRDSTIIYCDPPYFSSTRSGIGNGLTSRYLHDFHASKTDESPCKHALLAEQLRAFRNARIIVSYYDCPEVRALYEGWTVVAKTMRKTITQASGAAADERSAPEILLINGPSLTTGARGLF